MKKYLVISVLAITILFCSPLFAAPMRAFLIDSDEKEIGTASNPMSVSFSGNQVVGNSMSIGEHLTVGKTLAIDTDVLYVDSGNDRVGIGTNTFEVTSALEVDGGRIRIKQASGAHLEFGPGGSNPAWISADDNTPLTIRTRGVAPLDIQTDDTSAIYIDSSQNVGINTTSPQALLDLSPSGSTDGLLISPDNDGYSGNLLQVNSMTTTGVVTVLENGNVGIGTDTPASQLNIDAPAGDDQLIQLDFDSGKQSRIHFNEASGQDWALGVRGASDNFVFSTSSGVTANEKLVIDNTGNVGIGTTSPGNKLHVVGYPNIRISSSETDDTNKWGAIISSQYDTSAESEGCTLLGIDTNVADNIVYIGGGRGDINSATDLKFYTASNVATLGGTARMVIDRSGNVGIGTVSPSATLDVSGDLAVSSNVTLSGLPSGATQPAGMTAGQLWVDTDDQTLMVAT